MRADEGQAAFARHTRAAEILVRHRTACRALDRLPPSCEPADGDEGYAVQAIAHELLLAAGRGGIGGYKIGCTTPVMQEYLGIAEPAAGGVLASAIHENGAVIGREIFVRPGVECEIAVRIAVDLPPDGAPYEPAALVQAVASAHAAIEIVDDRYTNWRALGPAVLIADDFFGAGCVLGAEVLGQDWGDVKNARARLLIDGRVVGAGAGTEILGDPMQALAWLANLLVRRGPGLLAGDLVLLGSVVRTHWLKASEGVVRVEHDALGAVEASFRR